MFSKTLFNVNFVDEDVKTDSAYVDQNCRSTVSFWAEYKEQTLHKFTTSWIKYPGNNFAYNTNVPGLCYDQCRCPALKEDVG